MKRRKKNLFLFDEDEIYAEARNRIAECREKNGKKLDFSKLYLKEIPVEIAELRSLEELSLGSRHSSPHKQEEIILPPELANLRNLRNLSLGYDIPGIPAWVWTLDNLEALSVYNDSIDSIPGDIANLKRLSQLRIHGEKITALPEEIGDQLRLTSLDLECPLLKTLPQSFANLKTMKGFFFHRCNLTAVPAFLCGWTELEEFELGMDATFQGPYTKLNALPRNIGNLKKLNYLNLDCVSITKIPESLGDCPLEHLELSGVFKTVPETLGNCQKLKTLKLYSCKPLSLPDGIGKLSSLNSLEIRAPAIKIPESFGKLTSLEKINITAEDVTLPKSFGGLCALKELYIDSVKSLPDSIGNCKNLKIIIIDSDNLTELPESFCKLKKLEELHLDTFNLKALPPAFGGLASLKSLDVFSGEIASFPESMGGLKKLESLYLDAHNVKELPDSFKKLSYIKNMRIEIRQSEPVWAQKKNTLKKGGLLSFKELSTMSRQYRRKLFESYTVKRLETLLRSAPRRYGASTEEKSVFEDIMLIRYGKIKEKFKWTEENKKRIATVSEEFTKAWEDAYVKAKLIIDTLYEKEPDKDSFRDNYRIEITLHPDVVINYDDEEQSKDRELYDIITSYLNPETGLNMLIQYDPVTKNDDCFRESSHINRDLSWNIEGFGDIDLQGYYICYALHELYSHHDWAFSDIPRINNIRAEIKINREGGNF